jgi:hypothetical protein
MLPGCACIAGLVLLRKNGLVMLSTAPRNTALCGCTLSRATPAGHSYSMVLEIASQHFTFQAETSRQPLLIPYSGCFSDFEFNVNGQFTQARPANNTVKQFSMQSKH